MGYGLNLFTNTGIEDEFLCPICAKVLQDAVVLDPCQHAFCSDCIREWRTTSNTCPVDQIEIGGQKEPTLRLLNLLNKLQLRCPFAPGQCPAILSIGELPHHRNWCQPAKAVSNVVQFDHWSLGSNLHAPFAGTSGTTSGEVIVTSPMVHKITLIATNGHGLVLRKWRELVHELVEFAADQERIYRLLQAGEFSEAIETTLQFWRSSHGNRATINALVCIFRKYKFIGLSDEVHEVFARSPLTAGAETNAVAAATAIAESNESKPNPGPSPPASILESVLRRIGKRATFYELFDSQIKNLKSGKDSTTFQTQLNTFVADHKVETHSLNEIAAKCKTEAPELSGRILELQRLDRGYWDVYQSYYLAVQNLVGGKLTRLQYIEQENQFIRKRDELAEKIYSIAKNL